MIDLSTDVSNSSFTLSKLSLFFIRRPWFVPIILAAVTLVMHHSALNGFWRFDDGWLLGFAACYSPWEYFFLPSITREISNAFVTPWLPLTYDINLALFGLSPFGHYAHQLISLWLAAYMSFLVLQFWMSLSWAVFGAMLFLVGTPTVHIAQELITGHYLEGLIFACVAIYGFVRAIRGDGRYWLALGVFGYVLACACKEIYVPFPVLLLALPEGNWKKRFRFVVPFLLVTLLYLCWRVIVLGNVVGGYEHHVEFSLSDLLISYARMLPLLFGENFIGYLAFAALVILLLLNTRRRDYWLMLAASAALLLPLAPVAIWPGILSPNLRYLFVVWWTVAMGVAVLAGRNSGYLARSIYRIILVGFIGVAAIQANSAERKALIIHAQSFEALYRFALTNGPNDVLIPPSEITKLPMSYWQFMYNGFLSAVSIHGVPKPRPKLLSSIEAITAIDTEKVHVFRYDVGCRCVKDVSSTVPALLSSLPSLPTKRESRKLLIRFSPLPYPLRRDQPRITDTNAHGGVVENINRAGETLEIIGWTRLRDDEPEQDIALFVPVLPISQSLVSIERPDIVMQLNNSRYLGAGFHITLQFSSAINAAHAAAHLCALKMAGGSFAPIENPANRECLGMFQQQN